MVLELCYILCDSAFKLTFLQILFARKCGRDREISLLTTISSIAIGLKLCSLKSIEDLSDSEQSKLELQRAFWLYYAIEKPHALRIGQFSVGFTPSFRYTIANID